jgi:hypothetical protein
MGVREVFKETGQRELSALCSLFLVRSLLSDLSLLYTLVAALATA